jgi:two-component sensor histidine kinase
MVDADPVFYDFGPALTIGMIANELIDNRYQHAFPSDDTGRG